MLICPSLAAVSSATSISRAVTTASPWKRQQRNCMFRSVALRMCRRKLSSGLSASSGCAARTRPDYWIWQTKSFNPGAATPTKLLTFLLKQKANPTIPLLPLPAAEAAITNWIWCSATTSPPRSIPWACIIPMQSSITLSAKTSA